MIAPLVELPSQLWSRSVMHIGHHRQMLEDKRHRCGVEAALCLRLDGHAAGYISPAHVCSLYFRALSQNSNARPMARFSSSFIQFN
jgi:hypothetical protein